MCDEKFGKIALSYGGMSLKNGLKMDNHQKLRKLLNDECDGATSYY